MLRGEFFGFLLDVPGCPAPTKTISAPMRRCVDFDRGCIAWHHDNRLRAHGTRRIGHALRMVAARIRDDAAAALVR